MIRIDALWLATSPVDMRAGPERLLARVVQVFGCAQAHHGYWASPRSMTGFVEAGCWNWRQRFHDPFRCTSPSVEPHFPTHA
jgi:hypothetical protein